MMMTSMIQLTRLIAENRDVIDFSGMHDTDRREVERLLDEYTTDTMMADLSSLSSYLHERRSKLVSTG